MEKVHIHVTKFAHVDSGGVIWQVVELLFSLFPVKLYLPVFGQSLDICKRCTIIPAGIFNLGGDQRGVTASWLKSYFVGERGQRQTGLQVIQTRLVDGDVVSGRHYCREVSQLKSS